MFFSGVRLFLIRHGESIANKKGIYQGQTYDAGLSLLGRRQAEALAKRVKEVRIDKVLTSPLKRAIQTAEIIAHFNKSPVIVDNDLIEINHGDWEGKKVKEISLHFPKIYDQWKEKPSKVKMPNGEDCSDLLKRIENFHKKIQEEQGNIIAITHDAWIRIFLTYILGVKIDNMWLFRFDNCAVNTIFYQKGERQILVLNDTCHLEILKTDIAKQAL